MTLRDSRPGTTYQLPLTFHFSGGFFGLGKLRSRATNMKIKTQTEWLTPAGKPRNVPVYSATVRNTFLGVERTFRGSDRAHVTGRASSQLQKWAEQESRQKSAAAKQDALERGEAEAASMDADARETIEAVSSLLQATLAVDDRLDWNELRDARTAAPFSYAEPIPAAPDTKPRQFQVQDCDRPAAPWYVSFWPGARTSWEARCAAVDAENRRLREEIHASQEAELARCERLQAAHDVAIRTWHQRKAAANAKYEAECAALAQAQSEHNGKVDRFKDAFEQGVPQAVTEYLRGVFERSDYPSCFTVQHPLSSTLGRSMRPWSWMFRPRTASQASAGTPTCVQSANRRPPR